MKWLWISGWAVPPAWFVEQARAAWPEDTHEAVRPSAAAHALKNKRFDAAGGYSLGALWLLYNAQNFSANIPAVLLAPIFAFPAESEQGGRFTLAQLRLQRRRIRKDASAALKDFFQRAGLDELNLLPQTQLKSAEIAALDEELGWLENWRAPLPPPRNWRGWVGDQDIVLDGEILKNLWPALQIVSGANHAPGSLLRAAAKEKILV